MTDDDVRAAVAVLFAAPAAPAGKTAISGLVEQQRLFRKLR